MFITFKHSTKNFIESVNTLNKKKKRQLEVAIIFFYQKNFPSNVKRTNPAFEDL